MWSLVVDNPRRQARYPLLRPTGVRGLNMLCVDRNMPFLRRPNHDSISLPQIILSNSKQKVKLPEALVTLSEFCIRKPDRGAILDPVIFNTGSVRTLLTRHSSLIPPGAYTLNSVTMSEYSKSTVSLCEFLLEISSTMRSRLTSYFS